MPVKIKKINGGYRVSTPKGVKSKKTSLKNARKQKKILDAHEHGIRFITMRDA